MAGPLSPSEVGLIAMLPPYGPSEKLPCLVIIG